MKQADWLIQPLSGGGFVKDSVAHCTLCSPEVYVQPFCRTILRLLYQDTCCANTVASLRLMAGLCFLMERYRQPEHGKTRLLG